MDTTVMGEKPKVIKPKKEKRPKTKLAKAAIAIIVAVAIVFVGIGGFIFAANEDRSYTLYTKLVLSFMPNSIDDNHRNLTFYVEQNKEYDGKKDAANPMNAFLYYYKDADGKKVYIENGVYNSGKTGDEPTYVSLGFFYVAKENLNKMMTGFKISMAILAVIELVLCIGLWFQSWSRRQDEAKAEIYGSNKKSNNK